MNIRVLLVEDFPLVREGVAAALERDPAITVVGQAANGREGLALAHELRPDIVLLDLHMPELGGMMLLERLRAELPGVRTMVMTASEKGEPLLDAVAAGASGYLTKRASGEELRQAVLTVHGGGSVIATGSVVVALGSDVAVTLAVAVSAEFCALGADLSDSCSPVS